MKSNCDWRDTVAAAHAVGASELIEEGIIVHRVRGGANNALYRVEVDGRAYACKLCVIDERLSKIKTFICGIRVIRG